MKNKILTWLPRILVILVAVFFALMSLDIFTEDYRWYEMIVGLFMHNVPTLLILGALWVAWLRPRMGGWMFVLLAMVTVLFFNTEEELISFLIITLPILVIGVLFLFSSNSRRTPLESPLRKGGE
jgi:hypothetical protein